MIIYAGIDGTSSKDNTGYAEDFKNSFVNTLQSFFPDKSFYNRGPYTWGFKTDDIARKAYDHVVENWRDESQDAVFLAGYSRGGAAVIEVAEWLKQRKNPIPVECLILFDAVDRSTALGGWLKNTPIVDTVKQTIYPQRNIWSSMSRISFQNCGFTRESQSMPFSHRTFLATHGGLGGTPWKEATNPYTGDYLPHPTIWELGEVNATTLTPQMDAAGSATVWAWTSPQILRAKVECITRLNQPTLPNAPNVPPNSPTNPNVPNPPGNPPLKPGERLHIVKPGEWLSKIAVSYYGDMKKWQKIYDHQWNRKEIGNNPDLIKPNMRLVIPR